jgi:nucleoside-diphosphate kinase
MNTRTFAMIKPFTTASIGTVITFIESIGFQIVEMQMRYFLPSDVAVFYQDYVEKPFFPPMSAYMTSAPVVGMILELDPRVAESLSMDPSGVTDAISHWRYCLGATDSSKADLYTLRGKYGNRDGIIFKNIAHGSDSVAAFERESKFFFGQLPARGS